jgi:hypothetical protein
MNLGRRWQVVRELEDRLSWLLAWYGRTSVRRNGDREAMSAKGQVPPMEVEEGERVRWVGAHNLVHALRLCPYAVPRRLHATVRVIRNVRHPHILR